MSKLNRPSSFEIPCSIFEIPFLASPNDNQRHVLRKRWGDDVSLSDPGDDFSRGVIEDIQHAGEIPIQPGAPGKAIGQAVVMDGGRFY